MNVGGSDNLGRPTQVTATITKEMLGTGSNATVDPVGWQAGQGYNRSHLLAKILGGPGNDPNNLVTMFQRANSPVMRDFELKIRDAVLRGEVVEFSATPVYQGSNPIPTCVTMQATGSAGLKIDVTILNIKMR